MRFMGVDRRLFGHVKSGGFASPLPQELTMDGRVIGVESRLPWVAVGLCRSDRGLVKGYPSLQFALAHASPLSWCPIYVRAYKSQTGHFYEPFEDRLAVIASPVAAIQPHIPRVIPAIQPVRVGHHRVFPRQIRDVLAKPGQLSSHDARVELGVVDDHPPAVDYAFEGRPDGTELRRGRQLSLPQVMDVVGPGLDRNERGNERGEQGLALAVEDGYLAHVAFQA